MAINEQCNTAETKTVMRELLEKEKMKPMVSTHL